MDLRKGVGCSRYDSIPLALMIQSSIEIVLDTIADSFQAVWVKIALYIHQVEIVEY